MKNHVWNKNLPQKRRLIKNRRADLTTSWVSKTRCKRGKGDKKIHYVEEELIDPVVKQTMFGKERN